MRAYEVDSGAQTTLAALEHLDELQVKWGQVAARVPTVMLRTLSGERNAAGANGFSDVRPLVLDFASSVARHLGLETGRQVFVGRDVEGMMDNFEGYMSTSKYARMVKCSPTWLSGTSAASWKRDPRPAMPPAGGVPVIG
ncbi:MAG: hypothetical protein ACLFPO_10035 [Spirochaetaceae bacterium]